MKSGGAMKMGIHEIGGSRVSVLLEIAGFSRTQFGGDMNQPGGLVEEQSAL
jgi:hypothetical protein